MESFRELMGGNLIEKWDNVPNGNWDILEMLYQKKELKTEKKEKIPKKIHQIWLGEMPESVKNLIIKIKEKHPEWEYKLWNEEELSQYPMVNREMYNSVSNYGLKSDIARYEILFNEGGIYLDCDFEMVKSFDDLLYYDFFTGVGHSNEPMVYNGLIGCTKNNKIIENVLSKLKEKKNDINTFLSSHEKMMQLTGPYFFSIVFFEYINNIINDEEDIVVLPTPYFYPFPASKRLQIKNRLNQLKDFIYSFNTDKTICIHLWFNSWQ